MKKIITFALLCFVWAPYDVIAVAAHNCVFSAQPAYAEDDGSSSGSTGEIAPPPPESGNEGAGETAPPEENTPPEIGDAKDAPVDLSVAPQPREKMAGEPGEGNTEYARVEFLTDRALPNWTFTYKVFDADRQFRGRLIMRKFEADDLRYGRLIVLDKEYMFKPQRVIRTAYRKDDASPIFTWMTYQFGEEEKVFTADYYYDQLFVRDQGEKVFYNNALPNPPHSFDLDEMMWLARQIDIESLSGWRLLSINVPTLEESYQVRVTREKDTEVKGADFKNYMCAHLVFDYGYVGSGDRVKEHYFVELADPYRLIQYASGNILMLYESDRQGSEKDDFKPGQEVKEMPKLTPEGEGTEAGAAEGGDTGEAAKPGEEVKPPDEGTKPPTEEGD